MLRIDEAEGWLIIIYAVFYTITMKNAQFAKFVIGMRTAITIKFTIYSLRDKIKLCQYLFSFCKKKIKVDIESALLSNLEPLY